MAKTILLVDADASLREQIERALSAQGYDVAQNGDGKDVIEQARAAQPAAIVLCVELPKGSGYAICSKLRKDEALKQIPVVLTSAEATPKAFDDHKKLKFGRADEYLLKPFDPQMLVEKVMALLGDEAHTGLHDTLGLSDLASEFGDGSPAEERVSLDDIEEISVDDDLAPTPASLPGEGEVDLLETAFERLEDREQTGVFHGMNGASDPALNEEAHDKPHAVPPSIDSFLSDEPKVSNEDTQSFLESTEVSPPQRQAAPEPPTPVRTPPPAPRSRSISAEVPPPATPDESPKTTAPAAGRDREYFQLKDRLAQREKELLRLREEGMEKERELVEQREHETELEREIATKDEEIGKRDAQLRQLQQKIDSLVAGSRRTDKDLAAAREEARQSLQRAELAEQEKANAEAEAQQKAGAMEEVAQELSAVRQKVGENEAELERLRARNDEVEAELTGVRAQLEEANTSAEELRQQLETQKSETEGAQEDLQRRLAESEEEKRRHEEQLVKSYQRLKGEERVREKAKKALSIALQLLEDQSAEGEDEEEQRT